MKKSGMIMISGAALILGLLLILNVKSEAHPHKQMLSKAGEYTGAATAYPVHDERNWEEGEMYFEEEFGPLEDMLEYMEFVSGMFDVADQYSTVAESPTKSAIMAVLMAEDSFESPGEYAAFLEGLLPEVDSTAVSRAIRLRIADIVKEDMTEASMKKSRTYLKDLILMK
ncbi:hypothetical protein KS4_22570 [Poriferisphaera corsica]|uniref:Uncharacterized protein n=1 Tax=Poriferisphaera corsica TaxID=2528020 RepID=A0A517YVE3_9BACT|nr:hypothetical protein [Poriferisphaera corsica]QDU34194.1 hypothetical protein KS4_22570 [Poriferisphaera corsica]